MYAQGDTHRERDVHTHNQCTHMEGYKHIHTHTEREGEREDAEQDTHRGAHIETDT